MPSDNARDVRGLGAWKAGTTPVFPAQGVEQKKDEFGTASMGATSWLMAEVVPSGRPAGARSISLWRNCTAYPPSRSIIECAVGGRPRPSPGDSTASSGMRLTGIRLCRVARREPRNGMEVDAGVSTLPLPSVHRARLGIEVGHRRFAGPAFSNRFRLGASLLRRLRDGTRERQLRQGRHRFGFFQKAWVRVDL
jgi:hypothetical protein